MSILVQIQVRLPDRLAGAEAHHYERVLVGLIDGASWQNEGLPPPEAVTSHLVVDLGDPRGPAVVRAAADGT